MKRILLFLIGSLSLHSITTAQNVGIGTNTPTAKLDINGDLIVRSFELTIADGVNYSVDINTNKFSQYKLTGPTGNFVIAGITSAVNDRTITLFNRTGNSLELYNDDATAAVANRIITGTGTTFAVYSGGAVTLRYDGFTQKWEVISSHYNNLDYFGGGGGGNWDVSGLDIYNVNTGNVGVGTNSPTAKLTINGNLALLSDTVKVSCDIMPTKLIIDNMAKPKSVFHVIDDGCIFAMPPNIIGLSGGSDGKIVTIISHVNSMQIQHLQGTTPTPSAADSVNMIELYEPNSNGAINQPYAYTFNKGGSITLIYDGRMNRWKPLSYYGDVKSETYGWLKGTNANDIYNPNAGNVGIGTGNPTQKLDINGNTKIRTNLFVDGSIGIGTITPTDKLQIVDDNLMSGSMRVGGNNANGQPKLIKFGDLDFVSIGENTADDRMELTATTFYFKKGNGLVPVVGIGNNTSSATLSAIRGTGTDGTAAFFGTTNVSHFNYSTNEDTYIRGGKAGSKTYINDYGGQVGIGTVATGNAQLNIVSSRIGSNANGVSINQSVSNPGNDSYGLYTYANGSNLTNYGIKSEVGGTGTSYNIAGEFYARTASAGNNTGIIGWGEGSLVENKGGKFDAFGGVGSTVNYGLSSYATGAGDTYGVYTRALSTDNYSTAIGMYSEVIGGNALAGFFKGNVSVVGSLSKSSGSFLIDHPLDPANKYLYHSFVESPDMMNVYNGNVTTDSNGEAEISLPDYFMTLNKDYRYQLTSIGQPAQVWVMKEISNNQFAIKTDKPNVKISWQVTGIRQDAWANEHRIIPEVEKATKDKGKYLTPEVFGQPREKGINYIKTPR